MTAFGHIFRTFGEAIPPPILGKSLFPKLGIGFAKTFCPFPELVEGNGGAKNAILTILAVCTEAG